MRLYHALQDMSGELGSGIHAAIGSFDGFHRGHQAVVRAMLRQARRANRPAVVVTFNPHPMTVLSPAGPPLALTTPEQRARILEEFAVDALVELPFTRELAAVSAETFVLRDLCLQGQVGHAFVGEDFSFGAGGAGSPSVLSAVGERCGLRATVVPLVVLGGQAISSTRIRKALAEGRVGPVRQMLGRPFALVGVVVAGDGRGRTIGFPTANLATHETLAQPKPGVYAVRVRVRGDGEAFGEWLLGVANLGVRPTVGGTERRLEVHILDWNADLYGRELEVAFVRHLRAERRFADVVALREQIMRDAARARFLLATERS